MGKVFKVSNQMLFLLTAIQERFKVALTKLSQFASSDSIRCKRVFVGESTLYHETVHPSLTFQ